MKKLFIYRGLPGSGKSYALFNREEKFLCICSTDHFFMKNGVYEFNPHLIAQAHADCQIRALRAMAAGVSHVAIDNTNVQRWEFKLYLTIAEIFGYEVEEVVVGGYSVQDVVVYANRNIHGVPLVALQAMAARWED